MTDCILSCGSVGFSAHRFLLVSGADHFNSVGFRWPLMCHKGGYPYIKVPKKQAPDKMLSLSHVSWKLDRMQKMQKTNMSQGWLSIWSRCLKVQTKNKMQNLSHVNGDQGRVQKKCKKSMKRKSFSAPIAKCTLMWVKLFLWDTNDHWESKMGSERREKASNCVEHLFLKIIFINFTIFTIFIVITLSISGPEASPLTCTSSSDLPHT